jgi:hypothetical protein
MATNTRHADEHTDTISCEAVIRAARRSNPPLKTLHAISERGFPQRELMELRTNTLMTIATNGNDDYARVLGLEHMTSERPSDPNTYVGPKFTISTNLAVKNPDRTARVSFIEEARKEYVEQMVHHGIDRGTANRQFQKRLRRHHRRHGFHRHPPRPHQADPAG